MTAREAASRGRKYDHVVGDLRAFGFTGAQDGQRASGLREAPRPARFGQARVGPRGSLGTRKHVSVQGGPAPAAPPPPPYPGLSQLLPSPWKEAKATLLLLVFN